MTVTVQITLDGGAGEVKVEADLEEAQFHALMTALATAFGYSDEE